MKLAIFGATGTVGQHLVEQALELGHDVTALSRSPLKLPTAQKNLTVLRGDVLDPVAVKKVVAGKDAVLCALGMPLFNKDGLRTSGTQVIVGAMQDMAVKRLVCLSVMGAGDSKDQVPFHYRHIILPLLLRHVCRDHEGQEAVIRDSHLDWTCVRPVNFTKGPRTGTYWSGTDTSDAKLTMKIAAADVADFMLRQLTNGSNIRKAACLSYQADSWAAEKTAQAS